MLTVWTLMVRVRPLPFSLELSERILKNIQLLLRFLFGIVK